MKQVTGRYAISHYSVYVDGVLYYRAGNHKLDSQIYTSNPEQMVPFETMKRYCEQTCQDIAEEVGGVVCDVKESRPKLFCNQTEAGRPYAFPTEYEKSLQKEGTKPIGQA